jgi:type II secretory pathway pseudopilin PulG
MSQACAAMTATRNSAKRSSRFAAAPHPEACGRHTDAGYTLVALLALMTVLAISLTAAAPIMKQQAQRERELEAIRRGEEVADAIRDFYRWSKPKKLPNSMDELIEGANVGRSKKLQVLRASAARDPLTEKGEWRLIRTSVTNSSLCDFAAALTKYNEGTPVLLNDEFNGVVQPCPPSALGSASGGTLDDTSTGPFIGVASRSSEDSVVTYYGIEKHNEWVFTRAYPKQN